MWLDVDLELIKSSEHATLGRVDKVGSKIGR